jgi:DNA repair protein RadD
MKLRDYQVRVLGELTEWFNRNDDGGDPIVEACVGAGKSVMIAEWCRAALTDYPGTRILMVVHVKELCQQNLDKLLTIWPDAPAGVHSASIGRKDLGEDIMYATIGSVYRKAHLLGRVDMVLVDECHLIGPNDATMYRQLIDELRTYNPFMRVIGWTGTAFRGDGLWLTHHGLFRGVAARVGMRELLDQGYLSPLTIEETGDDGRIDASGVKMSGGDYVVSSLAAAADKEALVEAACDEIVRRAAARKRWLVYGCTIAHAEHIRDALERRGIDVGMVTGKTPKGEREDTIDDFRAGRLRALVNVAVLTTGFDAPEVDCIAMLRPTKSPVLYVQIAGRGMRIAPGKTDCLWLDFTSTTLDLGPVDLIKGANPKPKGIAPHKFCDSCGASNPTGALACSACGVAFPPPAEPDRIKHSTRAGFASVLGPDIRWHPITSVGYDHHEGRDGKPDSLRVSYWSGLRRVASEWVCVEHQGYARAKAEQWWQKRALRPYAGKDVPRTVFNAVTQSGYLREPVRLLVSTEGKWPEIIEFDFGEQEVAA